MINRSDNFNRTNSAVGTPSDGGSAYEVLAGAVNVSSNAAAGSGAARDIAVLETSSTRVDVEVTIPAVPAGNPGPVARVQDGGSFFIAVVRADLNTLQLNRYSGGTNAEIVGSATRTFQAGDVIKLSVDGTDTWRVYVNGTLAIGPIVRSQYSSSTKHGIGYIYSNDKLDTLAITDTNVPLTAGTLSHSSHTHNSAILSWTAGVGGTGSISTQLQRSASGAGSWTNVSGATSSPATNTGLSPSTAYDYRVRYTDSASTPATAYSNTVTVTTDAPPPIPDLTVTGLGSGIASGGTDAAGSVQQGGSLSRSYTLTNIGGATLTLGTISVGTGLTIAAGPVPGQTVAASGSVSLTLLVDTSTVGAFSSTVSVPSDDPDSPHSWTVTATVSTPVGVPSDVQAKATSDYEAVVAWDCNGGGASGVVVERKTGSGGSWATVATLSSYSEIWNDTSLWPATTYFYRVRNVGNSTNSAEVSITTATVTNPLGIPTNPAATANSPFQITVTCVDAGGSGSRNIMVERSSDGGVTYSPAYVASAPGSGSTFTFIDKYLTPATSFSYRFRQVNGAGQVSNFTSPVSATTQSRVSGTPVEATGLAVVVTDSTTAVVSWTDTNSGAAAYVIETAAVPGSGLEPSATYSAVQTTAAGATSATITLIAGSARYVRVRAQNGDGQSSFTKPVRAVTPVYNPGGSIYQIGPGKTYTSLGGLNWDTLKPGDILEIYCKEDSNGDSIPYYEKPMVCARGTATNPITIRGVRNAKGQRPIIDGVNAVTPSWASISYSGYRQYALLFVGTHATYSSGWQPGYLSIEGLEFRNAYGGDNGTLAGAASYTSHDGTTETYAVHVAGIYVQKADHLTIRDRYVHDNSNGIFGASKAPDDNFDISDVLIESNYIKGNGTAGGYLTHNLYLQAISQGDRGR